MVTGFVQHQWKMPTSFMSSSFLGTGSFLQNHCRPSKNFKCYRERNLTSKIRRGNVVVCGWLLPVDPWAPNIDSASIAPQLFVASLFPYLGFLYFITKSKSAPNLTLFGFYFLLAFVGATIVYCYLKLSFSFNNFFCLVSGAIVSAEQSQLGFTQRCIMVLPCPMLTGYMVGLSLFSL